MKRHFFPLISVIVFFLLTSCKLTITSFDAQDTAETGTAINLLITATADETGDGASDHGVIVQIPESWQVLYGKVQVPGHGEFPLGQRPDYAALYTPQAGHKIWVGTAGRGQGQSTTLTFKVRVMTGDFPGNLGDTQVFSLKAAVGVFRDSAWATDDPAQVLDFNQVTQALYVKTITVNKVEDLTAPDPVSALIITDNYHGSINLSWSGYDEQAQKDVANYRIYKSSDAFTSVNGMTPEYVLNAGIQDQNIAGSTYGTPLYFAVTAVDELLHENVVVAPVSITPHEGGYITGTVTNQSTGQPIPDLNVVAYDFTTGNWIRSAQSQSDGSYAISALPEGTYRVEVDAGNSGYIRQCYAEIPGQCFPVQVTWGATTSGIDFRISGKNEWIKVGTGLWGGTVSSLAINPATPETIYAGTQYNGLFKSINGGNDWTAISSGLTNVSFYALALNPISPETVYAGTNNGLFKSTNGGSSWSTINTGLSYTYIRALAINSAAPDTIYAGTNNDGVIKSTNGGSSWTIVNTGLTNPQIRALAINPLNPDIIYAGTSGGDVFRSTDGGNNWYATDTSLIGTSGIQALAINPMAPEIIYAGTYECVFKSTDGGDNWTIANIGLSIVNVHFFAIDPAISSTIYAGSSNGIFKSSNSGGSWNALNIGLSNRTAAYAFVINPQMPGILYVGTDGSGVFKSIDEGNSWAPVNRGLDQAVEALAINPATTNIMYAGTSGSGVFKSTDGGSNWAAVNTGLDNYFIRDLKIDPDTPETIYSGTFGGVFKSTDGGNQWAAVNTGLSSLDVTSVLINQETSNTIYAATKFGSVFKSTNAGSNWEAVNNGLPNMSVWEIDVDPNDFDTIYACTIGGGIFKSTNGGNSWISINNGLPGTIARDIIINPLNPFTAYSAVNGVFKSIDGGDSWTPANTGLTNTSIQALEVNPMIPDIIYAGTFYGGVFESTDGGLNWINLGVGLTDTYVYSLEIHPSDLTKIYACTYKGLFVYAGSNQEQDTDGDGIPDGSDAFPHNDSEWQDTDGDGIGNNADLDDDDDGITDIHDRFPLDPSERFDTDGDGMGDTADTDDDNDGVDDPADNCPYVYNPDQLDSESDGVGDACRGSFVEDFESGGLNSLRWSLGGIGLWHVNGFDPLNGAYSAQSPQIGDNEGAWVETTQECRGDGISFWYSVSSDPEKDFLKFYVDDVLLGSWSGSVGHTKASFPVAAGEHRFRWEYAKDSSGSAGTDKALIDDVVIYGSGEVIPGDVNGNGIVELQDAILALGILAGHLPISTVSRSADVNGDHRVGIEEVLFILQKSATLRGLVAGADSYNWIGNTPLTVPAAFGLLSNDTPGSTIAAADVGTALGGTVTVNPDGGFTYVPPFNVIGTDSFTYTLTGVSGSTTATIQMFSRVWYVNNTVASGGDGSFANPFNTLVAAQTASSNGDTIFVFSGAGSSGQDEGIVLKPYQKLLGQGIAFEFVGPFLDTRHFTIVPAGLPPVIRNVNVVTGATQVVKLANGNEVAGFTISGDDAQENLIGIYGVGIAGFNIHDNLINAMNKEGILLYNALGTGPIAGIITGNTFSNIAGQNPGNAIDYITTQAGSVMITNNTFSSVPETCIRVRYEAGMGTVIITGNAMITTVATNAGARGIDVDASGTSMVSSTISNNLVGSASGTRIARSAIHVGTALSGTHRAAVLNNTVVNAGADGSAGIEVQAGSSAAAVCFQPAGNSSNGNGGPGYILDNRTLGTLQVEGDQTTLEAGNTGTFSYLPAVASIAFVAVGTCGL